MDARLFTLKKAQMAFRVHKRKITGCGTPCAWHVQMLRVEAVMMQTGHMEMGLVQYVALVAETPLDDTASHAAYAEHIKRIRSGYEYTLGERALEELDLRVGLLDAACWANHTMARLMER